MAGEADIWQPRTILEVTADTKTVTQKLTATQDQQLFVLTDFAYTVGTGALQVYKNGSYLTPAADFVEQTDTTFSLAVAAEAGDQITAVGNVGISGTVDVRDTDIFETNYQALRDYAGVEDNIYVQGKVTKGDGGEAFFQLQTGAAPGTYVDDNLTTVVPTGGDGSSAWIRSAREIDHHYTTLAAAVADAANISVTDNLRLDDRISGYSGGGGWWKAITDVGNALAIASNQTDIYTLKTDVSLQLVIEPNFNARQLGATGVITDDATDYLLRGADITPTGGSFYVPEGDYDLTTTWPIPSNITIYGDGPGTRIYQTVVDAPVIASKNWLTAYGGSATGRVIIRDLEVYGHASAVDTAKTSQHGIVLRDYYSTIRDVKVAYCGADGIIIDAKNEVGTEISGTLVENKIVDCDLYFNGGHGVRIGNTTSAKVTDGYLKRCNIIVDGTNAATGGGVYCDNSAGWNFSDIHTYNNAVDSPIVLANTYFTNISNIYIERFIGSAITVTVQKATNLDNINIRLAATGTAITASDNIVNIVKTGAVSTCEINISNVNIEVEQDISAKTPIYAIEAQSGNTQINLSNFNVFGAYAQYITLYNLSATNTSIKIGGEFKKSSLETGVSGVNDIGLCNAATSGLLSAGGAQSVNLDVGKIQSYGKIIGTLSIHARSNHNGAVTATYVSDVMISTKLNGTDAWTVDEVVLSAAAGFSAGPTVAATHDGSDLGHLDIDFTFADATSQGACVFNFVSASY